jgi:hypothetical protein
MSSAPHTDDGEEEDPIAWLAENASSQRVRDLAEVLQSSLSEAKNE